MSVLGVCVCTRAHERGRDLNIIFQPHYCFCLSGSPYGTPSQRQRPPDGSIPTDMRYSGGNAPPPPHPR